MVVGRLKCFISFISSICLIFLSGVEISVRLKVKFLAYFGSRNSCIVLTCSFRFRYVMTPDQISTIVLSSFWTLSSSICLLVFSIWTTEVKSLWWQPKAGAISMSLELLSNLFLYLNLSITLSAGGLVLLPCSCDLLTYSRWKLMWFCTSFLPCFWFKMYFFDLGSQKKISFRFHIPTF